MEQTLEIIFANKNKISKLLYTLKDTQQILTNLKDLDIEEVLLKVKSKSGESSVLNILDIINILEPALEKERKHIETHQKSCTHHFVYEGCDSHHDYYECAKCGATYKD